MGRSVGRKYDQILIFSKFFKFGLKILGTRKFRPVVPLPLNHVSWLWSRLPRFQLHANIPENHLERYDIRSKQSSNSSEAANREVSVWKLCIGCHF